MSPLCAESAAGAWGVLLAVMVMCGIETANTAARIGKWIFVIITGRNWKTNLVDLVTPRSRSSRTQQLVFHHRFEKYIGRRRWHVNQHFIVV